MLKKLIIFHLEVTNVFNRLLKYTSLLELKAKLSKVQTDKDRMCTFLLPSSSGATNNLNSLIFSLILRRYFFSIKLCAVRGFPSGTLLLVLSDLGMGSFPSSPAGNSIPLSAS